MPKIEGGAGTVSSADLSSRQPDVFRYMPEQTLELLDPDRRILSSSRVVRDATLREHDSLASLLRTARSSKDPLIALADAAAMPDDSTETCARSLVGRLDVFLVAVRDDAEGRRWLRAGATDFVTIDAEGGAENLDARCERLLRWHGALVGRGLRGPEDREYLRRLAHDIRGPLGCIIGYVELLMQETGFSEAVREDLGQILRNADALSDICDEMSGKIGGSGGSVPLAVEEACRGEEFLP